MSEAFNTVAITVDALSGAVSPNTPQSGGVRGDNRALQLVFEPLDSAYRYQLEITDGSGAYDITEPMRVTDGALTFAIPAAWTAPGTATIRLVAVGEGDDAVVRHYQPLHLYFADREDGEHMGEATLCWQTAMIKATAAAEEAVAIARAGAHEAQNVAQAEAQALRQAADDGAFVPVLSVGTVQRGSDVAFEMEHVDTAAYRIHVTLPRGEKGDKGDRGETGADGTVTFEALTDAQRESLKGDKGDNGDNGVSPTVEITEIEGGHRLAVTDANGTQTVDVLDGVNPEIEEEEYGTWTPEVGRLYTTSSSFAATPITIREKQNNGTYIYKNSVYGNYRKIGKKVFFACGWRGRVSNIAEPSKPCVFGIKGLPFSKGGGITFVNLTRFDGTAITELTTTDILLAYVNTTRIAVNDHVAGGISGYRLQDGTLAVEVSGFYEMA